MATTATPGWKVSFEDPAGRAVREQQDANDAAEWQALESRARLPQAVDGNGVRDLVAHLAPQYGIPAELAVAIAQTESNFNPKALSPAGAQGVMQIMPGTGKRYGLGDPYNPEQNVRAGLKYLADLQQLFPGRRDLQMAAYNAGEGAVKRYGNSIPPYPETQDYVRKVTGLLASRGMQQPYQSAGAGAGTPVEPGMWTDAQRQPAKPQPEQMWSNTPPVPEMAPSAPMPQITGMEQTSPIYDSKAEQGTPPWAPARKHIEPGLIESPLTRLPGRMATGALSVAQDLLAAPAAIEKKLGLDTGIGALATATAQDIRDYVTAAIKPSEEGRSGLDTAAEAMGAGLAFMVPSLGAHAAVSSLATQAPKLAAAFGISTSAVLQGASSMGSTYETMKPLVGEQEAANRANHAFWANTALGAVGSALGIFNQAVPQGLAYVVTNIVSAGVQGAVQYDVTRREFWVEASNPNAAALEKQGWEKQGNTLVQPYRFKDQLEAALVQSLVGGAFGAIFQHAPGTEGEALKVPEALRGFESDAGFSVEKAVQAAMAPDTPAAGVPLPLWQKWAKAILDMLPEPGMGGDLLSRTLGSQRGALDLFGPSEPTAPNRKALLRQRSQADTDLLALDEGGDAAQRVAERLGVGSPAAAQEALRQQRETIVASLAAMPAETPATPTLTQGAEGVTQEQYRTQAGGWRIPLKDMPTAELELQDAIRQPDSQGRWGIKLVGETDVPGELRALISPKETGITGLQNNRSGLTLQEMSEKLQEYGFLATADKESLLHALDRSVTQGQNMYSLYATGRVPLIDNPHVEAAYAHTLDAVRTLEARTEEQRRGTRPHAEAQAEAQTMIESGGWTIEDMRDLIPGTVLDDTGLGQVVLSSAKLGEQLAQAAQRVVETGGRPGSNEVLDMLSIQAMFAEIDPARKGVIAEAGRGLSFLNQPMSGYNRYLDAIHQVMLKSPDNTPLKLARQILALSTPAEAALEAKAALPGSPERVAAETQAMADFAKAYEALRQSNPEFFRPLRDAKQADILASHFAAKDLATREGFAARLEALRQSNPEFFAGMTTEEEGSFLKDLGPVTTEEADAMQAMAKSVFLGKVYREAGLTPESSLFAQRHAREPLSHYNDPTVEELPLLTPGQINAAYIMGELAWGQLSAAEQEAAKTALRKFATFVANPDPDNPDAPQTALMLDARGQGAAPSTLSLAEDRVRLAQTPEEKASAEAFLRQTREQLASGDKAAAQARVLQAQGQLRMAQAALQNSRPGFAEMWTEQSTAAKLGPTSWVRNELGNAGMGLWGLGTRFLAEQIGRLHPDTGVAPGESAALLRGLTHGWIEHWNAQKEVWAGGESQFSPGNQGKTDVYPKAVTAENLKALGLTFGMSLEEGSVSQKVVDFWANYIGFLSGGRTTHRIMNSRDEFYKSWNYTGQRNALAWRELQRAGLADGPAFADHMAQAMTDPNIMERIDPGALAYSLKMTLQEQVTDERPVASMFSHIAGIKVPIPWTEEQQLPIGRMILPFVKIPVNGAKIIMENSPLALATREFWGKVWNMQGGPDADMALSQAILGSVTMAAVAGLVAGGDLTGRAPDNEVLRDAWLKQHPEYSVRFPGSNVWIPYTVDPFGGHIAMVADAAQIMGAIPDEQMAKKLTVGIGYPVIKDLFSQTAAKTIADLFGVFSPRPFDSESSTVDRALKYAARLGVGELAPVASMGYVGSTGARAFIRMDDPATKEAHGLLNQVYRATPGWSHDVPAHTDLNGDPMYTGYGIGPETLAAFNRGFFPLRPQEATTTPANAAIVQHQMKLGYPSRVLDQSGIPEGTEANAVFNAANFQPLVLNDAQYERLKVLSAMNQERAQKVFPAQLDRAGNPLPVIPPKLIQQVTKMVGMATIGRQPPQAAMGLGDMLDWIASQPEFLDDTKASPGAKGGKTAMLATAIHHYYKAGKELFLEIDPSGAGDRYREGKIQMMLEKTPEPKRESTRLMMQTGNQRLRGMAREGMGLPPLHIGNQ